MGVINITPNSFSDGNKFNQVETFERKFLEVQEWADIIDIGAESTAPSSKEISKEEEIKRFESVFLPFLEKTNDPKITISIDTYKVAVFKFVAEKVRDYWPDSKIIFNDISGLIDNELKDFIKNSKLQFTYVFCHNLSPKRQSSQNHMNYTQKIEDKEFLKKTILFLQNGMEELKDLGQDFIIDPCFGFSKDRNQNQYLIKNFKTFLLQFPYEVPVMFGVSRKSFLRFPANLDMNDPQSLVDVDHIQSILIYDLLKENYRRQILFRLHGPASFRAAMDCKKIFDIV